MRAIRLQRLGDIAFGIVTGITFANPTWYNVLILVAALLNFATQPVKANP